MTGFDSKRQMVADKLHWSDCAVHNGPAYPASECDCGAAQEPVARVSGVYGGRFTYDPINRATILPVGMALYSAPPQRQWVGLTYEEIEELFQSAAGADEETVIRFARLIESKIKQKNT